MSHDLRFSERRYRPAADARVFERRELLPIVVERAARNVSLTPVRVSLLGCLLTVALSACSAPARTEPVPSAWPSATLVTVSGSGSGSADSMCRVQASEPTTSDRDALPDDPRGAQLLWFPGLNAGTPGNAGKCRTWHTILDAAAARRLVDDLKSLPDAPAGVVHCPMADASFVQAWFTTDGEAVSFRIGLTGCHFDRPSDVEHLGPWPVGVPSVA